MNRIEIVGLFSAMERMFEKGDVEGVRLLVNKVLREAETKKTTPVIKDKDTESQ